MNPVDSCGWLEYFADGPGARFFAPAIEKTEELLVPSIVLFEVYKRIGDSRCRVPEAQGLTALTFRLPRWIPVNGWSAGEALRSQVDPG